MSTKLAKAAALVLILAALVVALIGCGRSEEPASVGLETAPTPGDTVPVVSSTATTQASTTNTATQASTTTAAPQESTTNTLGQASTTTTPAPPDVSSSGVSISPDLEPIVVPTLPEEIPGYTEVDPATGLHMTGHPQVVDLAGYRLKVTGKVGQELSLTYDELRSLPKVTARVTLVCPGFFEDTATWSGAPLHTVLEMAGVQPEAEKLLLTAADGFSISISLEDALLPENFLAYELEGEPVPVLHGFPVRAIFPKQYGSLWAKWLIEIEVV